MLRSLAIVAAGASLAPGALTVRSETDVSRALGVQSEVSVAVSPVDPRVLVAGSNNYPGKRMRAYSSSDGGATWVSTADPPVPHPEAGGCAAGDPAVGIDRLGREYFAFVKVRPCDESGVAHLYVATRAGPGAAWARAAEPVSPLAGAEGDDKPALAVDTSPVSPHRNRVYVAWSRFVTHTLVALLVSHSDDGGLRWSKPVRVNDVLSYSIYASVAVARNGRVYVSFVDAQTGEIYGDSAPDGVRFGTDRLLTTYSLYSPSCFAFGISIPAQPRRCVTPNPTLAIDTTGGPRSGRVYLTYGNAGPNGALDVYELALDARLRPLRGFARAPRRVNPPDRPRRSDQFWPAAALDETTGDLWICFYDTRLDPSRRRARFACTRSRDGARTFAPPVFVASRTSNERVPGADSLEYGDYEGLAAAGGIAHPMWTDSRTLRPRSEEIWTASVSGRNPSLRRGGARDAVRRPCGFAGQDKLVLWTTPSSSSAACVPPSASSAAR